MLGSLSAILLPLIAGLGEQAAVPNQHPLQPMFECVVDSRSYVKADLFVTDNGQTRKLATFGGMGPAGSCEFAWRNARNGVVCIGQNYTVKSINWKTGATVQEFGSESIESYRRCNASVNKETLRTQPGYMDFIAPERLAPFKSKLPAVQDAEVQAVLKDDATIFYDDLSMVFTYQDSQGNPMGLRANRVAWDVGSNATEPDIHKLVEYFVPGHFRSPFGTAAGMDQVTDDQKYFLNFWRLPRGTDGKVIPVKYWQEGSRWRWIFPNGTYFGEVLFMKAPDDGSWHAFEIRTRKRYQNGWQVNAFRPFTKASELGDAIKAARPAWAEDASLTAALQHLADPGTLQPYSLDGTAVYRKIFEPIKGAVDYVPDLRDPALVKRLLDTTPFKSAEGAIWKEGGGLETYAPSTKAAFSIVPANYEAGVIAVNDDSCNRCHNQTGRMLGDLDGRIVLYGEMWGEDRIFTWHLFQVDEDSFTVSDGSRRVNPRMTQAGLVAQGKPASSDTRYGKVFEPGAD